MQKKYIHTEQIHNTKAAEIVVPLIQELFRVKSVLDVGCGTGTWLRIFNEYGITDFLGLDGSYVNHNQLVISPSHFKEADLTKPFDLQRKFDLVICLEVAEHLPETSADDLVASLCKHGERIIFSAAIPGQGGQNHINEQWTSYWYLKFLQYGFVRYDTLRPKIWNNENVDVWYRQNMFVFVKEKLSSVHNPNEMMTEIHPSYWERKIGTIESLLKEVKGFEKGHSGIRRSSKALINAVINKIFK